MRLRSTWALLLARVLPAPCSAAQSPPHQTDFPPEEFQARWNSRLRPHRRSRRRHHSGGTQDQRLPLPRQSNEFYYLCGIETPHAYLILNGKDRKATLVLPARDARLESAEGKVISSNDAELVKQITGVAAVLELEGDDRRTNAADDRRPGHDLYTPFAPAEGNGQSRGELRGRQLGDHGRPLGRPPIARGPFPVSCSKRDSRARKSVT